MSFMQVLWEFLPPVVLPPVVHLGVASYTVYADEKHAWPSSLLWDSIAVPCSGRGL